MRLDVFWAALLVLAASLTVSTLVPDTVGYVLVLGVYVVFIGISLTTDRFAIVYHWAVLAMVVLVWLVFTLTTALNPTGAGIVRLGAFTVITGVNLFVVPAVINRTVLHEVLASMAGLFVLISLPTVFIGSYGIAGFTITSWDTTQTFAGVVLHTPLSIFDNPNYLSGFAAIGVVAAGARFAAHAHRFAGLVGLNALGVILAGGRAALLALVAAGALYVGYRFRGRTAMAVLVGLGTFSVVAGFAIVFDIIPGPDAIEQINLGDRRATWTAAYEAILNRPILGWGPGNDSDLLADYLRDSIDVMTTHNSYIRLFLIGGILGGGAYLVLSIASLIIGLRNARSETVFTVLLLVVFLILQLFEGMTIFGLSLLSMLGALFVGYVQSSSPASRTMNITEIRRRIVGYTRQEIRHSE